MTAGEYLARALLVLLLLPAVILPWEGRRTPDWVYVGIAAGGMAAEGWRAGPGGAGLALAAALGCLALCLLAVTALRRREGLQVLTGGHIKLLAAGATWLGPAGAGAMLLLSAGLVILAAAVLHVATAVRRPDVSGIVAVSILLISLGQMGAG